MSYIFETEQVGLSETAFHLLRNKFNYKSIPYQEVEQIEVKRGVGVKNRLLLLAFGMASIGFACWYGKALLDFFTSEDGGHIYLQEIVVPVLPALIGVYMLYLSFRITDIFIVHHNRKRFVFILKSIRQASRLNEFKQFIKEHIGAAKVQWEL